MLGAFNLDQYILSGFHHQLHGYEWFFLAVTDLGSPVAVTVMAALTFLLSKDKLKVFATVLLIGMLFGIVVTEDVKELVKRPRPDGAYTSGFLMNESYSFPSGHTLGIFLAATIIGAFYGWKYRFIGYVIALAVGLSRMYLGLHYPSDVLGGAIIGLVMGELLAFAACRYHLYGGISLNKKIDTLPLTLTAFTTAIITLVTYWEGWQSIAITALTTGSLVMILYMLMSNYKNNGTFGAYVFATLGLLSAISLQYLQAYVLSLAIIAIAYSTSLALTFKKV